jgi:hypothetical protein
VAEYPITQEQIEIMHHCLGGNDTGAKFGWRNYYCAADGDRDCEDLVSLGLMVRANTINGGRDRYYMVSEAGRAALKEVRRG